MHKTPAVDVVFLAAFLVAGTRAYAAGFPVQQVDAVLGRSAQQLPGSVYKYSWPRSDLKVKVAGTPIAPGLALGSWAAFALRTDNTWVMGDLVLLQSETVPVIDKLQAGGFSIMGVHNHLMNEIPRVMYVHYMGEGGAVELARVLKEALGQSHTPMGPAAHPAASQKIPDGSPSCSRRWGGPANSTARYLAYRLIAPMTTRWRIKSSCRRWACRPL